MLDMSDIPESANEPGPGHYFGPESVGFSALGTQRFSKCQSAPEIHFAKTGWDEWSGVCISKEHEKAFIGRQSPGAAYDLPEYRTKVGAKIGTSLRPDLSRSLGVDPHGSPGPTYNVREANQMYSPIASGEAKGQVKKGFGLANRFAKEAGYGGIGPGEYTRKDVALNLNVGRSIGTGRPAWEKVVTPGWEIEGRCRASPGPGPPLWRDIKKEGSRGAPIGRAERFPRSASTSSAPGPGQYSQGEREVSRKKQYLSDTRNPSQTHFGKKPTKPRFRMALALRTGKHGGWGYF